MVIVYDGDDDVVCIVNDLLYGLLGIVYGVDLQCVVRIVLWLWVGIVNVNGGVWYCVDVLFGGYK